MEVSEEHVNEAPTSCKMAATNLEEQCTSVRKRHVGNSKTETSSQDNSGENEGNSSKDKRKEKELQSLETGTYWLTRIVLLRSVAFIYCNYVNLMLLS